jgi:hypothetical protein
MSPKFLQHRRGHLHHPGPVGLGVALEELASVLTHRPLDDETSEVVQVIPSEGGGHSRPEAAVSQHEDEGARTSLDRARQSLDLFGAQGIAGPTRCHRHPDTDERVLGDDALECRGEDHTGDSSRVDREFE